MRRRKDEMEAAVLDRIKEISGELSEHIGDLAYPINTIEIMDHVFGFMEEAYKYGWVESEQQFSFDYSALEILSQDPARYAELKKLERTPPNSDHFKDWKKHWVLHLRAIELVTLTGGQAMSPARLQKILGRRPTKDSAKRKEHAWRESR